MRRSDRGYVTAEAALVLPALVLLATALVWGLLAAAAQIRCVDAARAGARAAARSEPPGRAEDIAQASAPGGARIAVERTGELWRVRVEAPAPGPAALRVRLAAEAVAWAEDTIGPSDGTATDVPATDAPASDGLPSDAVPSAPDPGGPPGTAGPGAAEVARAGNGGVGP
ncbi:TadE family type IV pilus minor pilin [Streptomyces sp. NPDC097619]|uniref:TadE family type IV pilus minor pilin n=1 Tax=Streptomyces sp. NPDC097619 TaxID=3157228 RepID=UPI0033317F10